ncbi:TetR/AcrR family transcriptional regulator [Rhizobium sp. PAMB 3174]
MKDTRINIVEEADRLFYERGFEHTSFADIAEAVGISRGNFYYHFRTKDEILEAVIARRLASTREMLDRWQVDGASPEERIRSFIHILIANQAKIMLYGCPVGTLCGELAKLAHPAREEANGLFDLFRTWLARQFSEIGLAGRADALAMHLLARSQGVAALANAFHDEVFIRKEVDEMCAWLAEQSTAARAAI